MQYFLIGIDPDDGENIYLGISPNGHSAYYKERTARMNYVDAECACGTQFRWAAGVEPMRCKECLADPQRHLEAEQRRAVEAAEAMLVARKKFHKGGNVI